MWNIARYASDIQANYGLATLGTGVQGLLADWAFTEGQGNSTADTSGNGNTLTFVGSPAWSQSPASSLTITITGGVDLTIPDLPGGPDLSINGTASFHINLNQGTLDLNVDGTASLAPIGNFLTLDGTVHFDPPIAGANGVMTPPDIYGIFAVTIPQNSELSSLGITLNALTVLRFNYHRREPARDAPDRGPVHARDLYPATRVGQPDGAGHRQLHAQQPDLVRDQR